MSGKEILKSEEGEISRWVSTLMSNVDVLDGKLKDLKNRMSSVLLMEDEEEDHCMVKSADSEMSPLSKELKTLNDMLLSHIHTVGDIITRLDI